MTMGRQFEATAPESRATLRHSVFTESVHDSLSQLELAFRRTPIALTKERRTLIKFVRHYADFLIGETKKLEATGDLTSDWAVRVGYHVSYLTNVLLHGTANWGRHSITGAYAYRRFHFDDLTQPDAFETIYHDVDGEVLAFQRTDIAFVPSIHMYSVEGIVELMASGVHVLGLYLDKPSTVQDLRHDAFHGTGLAASFKSQAEYTNFRRRLSVIVERLKLMPTEKRSAGFAGLFYMFHEFPRSYTSVFSTTTMDALTLRVHLLEMKYRIVSQLSDPTDLGHGYPERILVWSRTIANPERLAALAYDALTEASLGL